MLDKAIAAAKRANQEASAEADAARDSALEGPKAARERAVTEALGAFRAALLIAYPGPTSTNAQIMDRLLSKFLQECHALVN